MKSIFFLNNLSVDSFWRFYVRLSTVMMMMDKERFKFTRDREAFYDLIAVNSSFSFLFVLTLDFSLI